MRQAQFVRPDHLPTQNRALRHILEIQAEISRAAGDLHDRIQQTPSARADFPANRIGKQLELAARLIAAHVPVAVIKVMHGSFDTHAGQLNTHHRLLEELAMAVTAFRSALVAQGLWDRVCVMTYSEFGRRAAENGSHGSDHGTAVPQFLLGGRIKGGMYGVYPSLGDLQEGDLRHTIDYRSVYNSIIRQWWGLPDTLFPVQVYGPLDCSR